MEQNLRRTEKKERKERKKKGKPQFSLKPWPTLFLTVVLLFVYKGLSKALKKKQYILHFYLYIVNSKNILYKNFKLIGCLIFQIPLK